MNNFGKITYLLIEKSAHKFDSRLLIGSHLLGLGMQTIISPQWAVWEALGSIPRGALLLKGNNTAQAKNMRAAKHFEHTVVSIGEELLGVSDDPEVERIYGPLSVHHCYAFPVHGEAKWTALSRIFGGACPPTENVGNPRIDLLRGHITGELSATGRAIAKRLGRCVMMNTNFASINPRPQGTWAYFEFCRAAGVADRTTRV